MLTHPSCLHTGFHERITPYTIARGIQSTRWPGRLSFHTLPFPSPQTRHRRKKLQFSQMVHTTLRPRLLSPLTLHLFFPPAVARPPTRDLPHTLAPLFALREHTELRLGVALLRFTPPEGMPWVRSVPPSELRETVEALVPDKSADIWVLQKRKEIRERN
ncbi:hypothetical protein A0H81_11061 [Grifola frondosa]|uniref:Uncharacterized protein n=1 Tax=Grifola frondosa TaxID=5627 RepID=A0A1C7LWE0_GRIFR|nr:hypothetical protein A0H81_11061 [Grifola frondosa]